VAAVRALEFAAIWREGGLRSVEVAEQAGIVNVGVLEVRLAIYALQHPRSHMAPT